MNRQYDGERDVLLFGAGGHAEVIIETLEKYCKQYCIIGITDGDPAKSGKKVLGVPVIGSDEIIAELYENGLKKALVSVGAVYDMNPRLKLFNKAEKIGFQFINVIHGTSVMAGQVQIGCGNVVLANTVVNAGAKIGNNCIINTGSIVEHHCTVGNNVHIAPGAVICGGVTLGDNCLIGAGSTVIQSVNIGANSIIGAGSVVLRDIPAYSTAVGVPARIIGKR